MKIGQTVVVTDKKSRHYGKHGKVEYCQDSGTTSFQELREAQVEVRIQTDDRTVFVWFPRTSVKLVPNTPLMKYAVIVNTIKGIDIASTYDNIEDARGCAKGKRLEHRNPDDRVFVAQAIEEFVIPQPTVECIKVN